ncbi:MAG: transcription elongation factor GreA, partial [Deltaproteobacteria bacterium]|nr:transcription elongation factor GreA [Deltaproteobacteria bacterium]
MDQNVMTKRGYDELRDKVRKMKAFDRQDIIKEIAAA